MRISLLKTTLIALVLGPELAHGAVGNNERLLNGDDAKKNEYPFMVRITAQFDPNKDVYTVCGGAILDDNTILSAAHCIQEAGMTDPIDASQVKVGYGSVNTDKLKQVTVDKIIRHPDYKAEVTKLENDISLLKLSDKLDWSDSTKPIKLCKVDLSDGDKLISLGWGKTSGGQNAGLSDSLKEGEFTVDGPINYCKAQYSDYSSDNPSVLCFDASKNKQDICSGDSGSPLIKKDDNNGELIVALDSYGAFKDTTAGSNATDTGTLARRNKFRRLCGKENTVNVFTRVGHFIDFIASTYNKSEDDLLSTTCGQPGVSGMQTSQAELQPSVYSTTVTLCILATTIIVL
ncbi:hypothetical protein EV182_000182 [Spiromyces aspiralis]|uniref:Uncharacterized protein n=1 Tax=Spiromyces aspiralis TaxID=68401 RepID=A0ACC1HV70_9FUNG|nr:hypothetical protein EV182_000182 [Spiromyces aspiralis]